MAVARCRLCGRPLDEHDRHVRMRLPDPVLEIPEGERDGRTWGGDPLLQVQAVGAFVRVLLPIRLTGGYTLTLGTWLAIDPSLLRGVWERWPTEEYQQLTVNGYLANAIPPWGSDVLAAAGDAAVRDPEQLPYIERSDHPLLHRVLTEEWPHEEILAAYAAVL